MLQSSYKNLNAIFKFKLGIGYINFESYFREKFHNLSTNTISLYEMNMSLKNFRETIMTYYTNKYLENCKTPSVPDFLLLMGKR